jgi:hypothetical protein
VDCERIVEAGATMGSLRAGRILALGNSITVHEAREADGWPHHCGMAASVPEKDYVHLLAAGIEAITGQRPRVSPSGDPANVVNIADIFERSYATYADDRLGPQLGWKADTVVLQFGENMPRETFDASAFGGCLRTLMGGLKASSDPRLYVLSQLLGAGGAVDEIKREVCAEDPCCRVYVDLSAFGADPANFASAEPYYTGAIVGHPGDKGMALIASTLLEAMVAHAATLAAGR